MRSITIPALTNNTWNKVTVPLDEPGNAALQGWNIIEFFMPLGSTWSGTVYLDAFKFSEPVIALDRRGALGAC